MLGLSVMSLCLSLSLIIIKNGRVVLGIGIITFAWKEVRMASPVSDHHAGGAPGHISVGCSLVAEFAEFSGRHDLVRLDVS